MNTVIYKLPTYEIVRVDDINNINIIDLKDDEDFMPVEMWNDSDDKEIFPEIDMFDNGNYRINYVTEEFPTIEIPSEGIIGNTSMAKMIDETIHPEKYKEYPLTPKESFLPICDAININVKTINTIINSLKDEEVMLLYDIIQGRVSNILNK